MKKIKMVAAWLFVLVMLCGCSEKTTERPVYDTLSKVVSQTQTPSKPVTYKNPLTGEYTLKNESDVSIRPVAVAVNNLTTARQCQTGLQEADIVYESYVEGGITRLLAVYKDISKVGDIGSVRSARYDFVDLSLGHDAVYVHAGMDETYCRPHINDWDVDDADLLNGSLSKYASRIDNDLAFEHTLYTDGESLDQMLTEKKWRTTVDEPYAEDWQAFHKTAQKLTGGAATTVSAKFSDDYTSTFDYDSKNGVYVKRNHNDWRSGNAVSVKNVVVLFSSRSYFGDGSHVYMGLSEGQGYYFSNGTYQKILWTKGEADDSFSFTDESGDPIGYNPGNSWICIVDEDKRPSFTFQ